MKRKFYIVILFAAATVFGVRASPLQFDSRSINVKPDTLSAKVVNFSFRYVNTSDRVVKISDVTASCGCTDITVTKRNLAPREEGHIRGVIDLVKRTQDTSVSIAVEIEGEKAPDVLSVRAELGKDVLWVSPPTLLVWRRGEEPQPKRFNVWVSKAGGIRLTKMDVVGDNFRAEVIEDRLNEGNYTIIVTPKSTGSKSGAVLTPGDAALKPYMARLRFHAYVL